MSEQRIAEWKKDPNPQRIFAWIEEATHWRIDKWPWWDLETPDAFTTWYIFFEDGSSILLDCPAELPLNPYPNWPC